jgi:HEPN domain-containing protein
VTTPYERDPEHWLLRLSPEEWIRAALIELSQAEKAFGSQDVTAATARIKRAAGMALNAALIVHPNETWGRSYVDHLRALVLDPSVPEPVRLSAELLLGGQLRRSTVVSLRSPARDRQLIEAARTVMAHAYALVHGRVGKSEGVAQSLNEKERDDE